MTTTFHRIGKRFYNFATVAEINVDPPEYGRPAKGRGLACVEIVSTVGHHRYVTGDDADALLACLESTGPGLVVVDVAPAPAEAATT